MVVFVLLVALGRLLGGGDGGSDGRVAGAVYFVQYISYMGILAPHIRILGILALGIRIQLTSGGWGWRALANGCCCVGVA